MCGEDFQSEPRQDKLLRAHLLLAESRKVRLEDACCADFAMGARKDANRGSDKVRAAAH
jgi:hypothetical protein